MSTNAKYVSPNAKYQKSAESIKKDIKDIQNLCRDLLSTLGLEVEDPFMIPKDKLKLYIQSLGLNLVQLITNIHNKKTDLPTYLKKLGFTTVTYSRLIHIVQSFYFVVLNQRFLSGNTFIDYYNIFKTYTAVKYQGDSTNFNSFTGGTVIDDVFRDEAYIVGKLNSLIPGISYFFQKYKYTRPSIQLTDTISNWLSFDTPNTLNTTKISLFDIVDKPQHSNNKKVYIIVDTQNYNHKIIIPGLTKRNKEAGDEDDILFKDFRQDFIDIVNYVLYRCIYIKDYKADLLKFLEELIQYLHSLAIFANKSGGFLKNTVKMQDKRSKKIYRVLKTDKEHYLKMGFKEMTGGVSDSNSISNSNELEKQTEETCLICCCCSLCVTISAVFET